MKVLDKINQRYGSGTFQTASQRVDEKWAMRRGFLTQQFTTNWLDIPRVKC